MVHDQAVAGPCTFSDRSELADVVQQVGNLADGGCPRVIWQDMPRDVGDPIQHFGTVDEQSTDVGVMVLDTRTTGKEWHADVRIEQHATKEAVQRKRQLGFQPGQSSKGRDGLGRATIARKEGRR